MAKPHRFGSALSVIAIAAVLSSCAGTGTRSAKVATGFGGKAGSNIGLAVRANTALEAGDYATAVDFAERAVANSSNDAGYRSLLGNAYFAAGRFASAADAYKDSLSLISNQPQVILRLALATIAQGKNAEALSFLAAGQEVLDASDYGLALALAGEPGQAITVLEASARQVGADARVRQNLALAYAIAGDWEQARTIAAQDLPGNLVDSRVQQWMTFAKPARASDQVATLLGVTPSAADPGQPTRLALRKDDPTRLAEAVVAAPQAPVEVAEAVPLPQPYYAPPAQPDVPPTAAYVPPAPEAAPAPPPLRPVRAVAFVPKAKSAPAKASGKSNAVVQLGAYKSRERVSVAWDVMATRYPGLRAYAPVTARFDAPHGVVWRLSIKGFASHQEAQNRCQQLRSKGGNCFVRSAAGDAPVRFASR